MKLSPDVAQRQICLGREQQHEQRGLISDVPGQQPQAHLDRDERRGERGGKLQDERRQERYPQRGHGRGPVLACYLPDLCRLRLGAAEDLQGRQALDHVQEVATQTRQRPPLLLGALLRVQSDQHAEHRDQGQRHRDDQAGNPVRGGDRGEHGQRDQAAEHELGQVPREVGVQCIEPLGCQRGDLAGLLPG